MVTKNIIDVRECWLLWMFDGNGNEDIELVTTLTGCVHRLEHHGYKLQKPMDTKIGRAHV